MIEGPEPVSAHRAAGSSATEAASTVDLLARVRSGDSDARQMLGDRCLPALRRWARHRLPAFARDPDDTADLVDVDDTVGAEIRRLDPQQIRDEGALQAYLRQALALRITDVIRRRLFRLERSGVATIVNGPPGSPLDEAVGAGNVARYDAALARLGDPERHAIIGRLELQYTYEQLADALGTPTADAARAAVIGAMGRLALEMQSLKG